MVPRSRPSMWLLLALLLLNRLDFQCRREEGHLAFRHVLFLLRVQDRVARSHVFPDLEDVEHEMRIAIEFALCLRRETLELLTHAADDQFVRRNVTRADERTPYRPQPFFLSSSVFGRKRL